ncbi:hypothetical protein ACJX0J_020904 [Zea mays]
MQDCIFFNEKYWHSGSSCFGLFGFSCLDSCILVYLLTSVDVRKKRRGLHYQNQNFHNFQQALAKMQLSQVMFGMIVTIYYKIIEREPNSPNILHLFREKPHFGLLAHSIFRMSDWLEKPLFLKKIQGHHELTVEVIFASKNKFALFFVCRSIFCLILSVLFRTWDTQQRDTLFSHQLFKLIY